MSTVLYHGEPNGSSLTVLATLFEKGVEAELKPIDLAAAERNALPFAEQIEVAMNVEGEGPVLVVDGEPITDALFIAIYLDEIGSGPALRPEGAYGHWQINTFCRVNNERLSPAASLLGTRAYLAPKLAGKDRAETDAAFAKIQQDDLRWRWEAIRDGDFAEAQLTDSHAKVKQAVERIEKKLGEDGGEREWLFGDFSIADIDAYAWLAGMELLSPAAFVDAPKTAAWLQRVKSRPSVARALALATVDEPLQAWAPGPEINRWG